MLELADVIKDKNKMTPMMRQYIDIKNQYPDTILFFRLGDFYEMFFDDAIIASKNLDLILTGKDCGLSERAPMCGIPYHSVDNYISKLVSHGYKVAICEQTEDPATAKNIVKREVTRTLTPGTIIESTILNENKNNYLSSFFYKKNILSCVFIDISTASVFISSFETRNPLQEIMNEFGKYNPSEVLVSENTLSIKGLRNFLSLNTDVLLENVEDVYFDYDKNKEILIKNIKDISSVLPELSVEDVCCFGSCVNYLSTQYKTELKNIKAADIHKNDSFMYLNFSSRRNLELTETMRNREKKGTLLWVLDKTKSPLGKRRLRSYLDKPLLDIDLILKRQNAVQELYDDMIRCDELRECLYNIQDLDRIMTRVIYKSVNAKDLRALANALEYLPDIKNSISSFSSQLLKDLFAQLDTLQDVYQIIDKTLVDNPPQTIREGGIIARGFSPELDELIEIQDCSTEYLKGIEQRERDRTGIPKIKVGYNRVFGYYIEVTNLYKDRVPQDYIRKQTLTNAERFITQELKELESKILSAKDKSVSMEYEIFTQLRENIAFEYDRVHKTAAVIGEIDALSSLAFVARTNHYCKPEIVNDGMIYVKGGRHPVVEKMLTDSLFVPNDTFLDIKESRCSIITGPNMAGKSTYMRQVALLVIMAQIGSFVPAEEAKISICDSIYTRVGASDDLASGQSTFMIEMCEVAEILKRATQNSLIIFDEIGRGTSTYDGMSIARAVLEYTCLKIGAKTLFATHYHELTSMKYSVEGVKNYNIAVKKDGDDITFLRRIEAGPADGSYGVEVSKLAGVPEAVVKRAKEILLQLEMKDAEKADDAVQQYYENNDNLLKDRFVNDDKYSSFVDKVKGIDVDNLTPIEAIAQLHSIVEDAMKI